MSLRRHTHTINSQTDTALSQKGRKRMKHARTTVQQFHLNEFLFKIEKKNGIFISIKKRTVLYMAGNL